MPETVVAAPDVAYRFGTFQLAPGRELLLDGDQPVRIGSRALRVLTVLVERAGEMVAKETLLDRVWPDSVVEEANLKVQVSALRRVLGDAGGLIANIPGRGYRFVAPVVREATEISAPANGEPRAFAQARIKASIDTPALLTRLIGRRGSVEEVRALLARHRFVTVAGAGGIGKTSVAIAATERLTADLEAGCVFVELAPVTDGALTASAIASALGVRAATGDPIAQIVEQIGERQLLLVLDNCEHVVDAAAAIAEELLARTPALRILATSREPLRARGEQTYRLGPLAFPAEVEGLDAVTALAFPAIELFVERARAAADSHVFGDADVGPVAQICRQLDGLPLALELAAAQIHGLGFANLAARLGDRFSLLTRGWRTARPRQQTLRATLDWSYELLTPPEQALLARLGVFADSFVVETAAAVGLQPEEDRSALIGLLSNLADKSMLSVDASGEVVRYGLLESTKAYARERLRADGSYEAIVTRRARAMREYYARVREAWTHQGARAWLQDHRHGIADVRASLEWALVRPAEREFAADLLLQTSQLWVGLGLLPEFFRHAERALQCLADGDANSEGDARALQMRLSSAIGHAIYEMGANPALTATMARAFDSALSLAKELGDARQQVRALYSQCVGAVGMGEYADVFPLADQFLEVGSNLPGTQVELLHNQSYSVASMMMGDIPASRRRLDACLAYPTLRQRDSSHEAFDFDPLIQARSIEARVLWMEGYPDQSLAAVRENVEDALALGHLPSYLTALQSSVMLIPVWAGDAEVYGDHLERYVAFGQRHNLDYRGLWRTVLDLGWRSTVENWSYAKARQALIDVGQPFNVYGNEMWAAYHPGFVLPEMVERVRAGKSGWCAAEVLRGMGEGRLAAGDREGAREAFDEAMALAESQGSKAWALRAAISLARLDAGPGGGRDRLAAILQTYSEGFATHDLRTAASLLA